MTLEDYLKVQQQLTETVLVERVSFRMNEENHCLEAIHELVEEKHPISEITLPWLKKIWTFQYETWQRNQIMQGKNRRISGHKARSTNPVEFNGKITTLPALADSHGIDVDMVRNRLARGWPLERALTEKAHQAAN